jgi:hypothetical protein
MIRLRIILRSRRTPCLPAVVSAVPEFLPKWMGIPMGAHFAVRETRSFDCVSASHARSGNSRMTEGVRCYADFSAAGVFANRISNTSRPAPTTIALSATLNAGH